VHAAPGFAAPEKTLHSGKSWNESLLHPTLESQSSIPSKQDASNFASGHAAILAKASMLSRWQSDVVRKFTPRQSHRS
jgi:hypothetical protein